MKQLSRLRGRVALLGLIPLLAGSIALAQSEGYSLTWSTIAGGGGLSSGGAYSLEGTLGQPEAGESLSGGSYTLSGGFWTGDSSAPPPPQRQIYIPLLLR